MNKSMTLFGCGPKMALICLPYIILALSVMYFYPDFLNLEWFDTLPVRIAGIIWLSSGFIFWAYSAVFFLRRFKPGELLTSGPFGWSRNPIYSSIIMFIVPGLAIIFHSGLILSIALELFIAFKLSVHGESIALRRIFGEEYDAYEKAVNEMFPFPNARKQ